MFVSTLLASWDATAAGNVLFFFLFPSCWKSRGLVSQPRPVGVCWEAGGSGELPAWDGGWCGWSTSHLVVRHNRGPPRLSANTYSAHRAGEQLFPIG